jgi:hypothetical protein
MCSRVAVSQWSKERIGTGVTEVAAVVGALVVVCILVAAFLILRRVRGGPRPFERAAAAPPSAPGEAQVTLPVDDVDPQAPAVQRLATEAAHRVLAAQPEIEVIVVLSRPGRLLARVERSPETRAAVDFPTTLLEPHAQRHREPGYTPDSEEPVGAPVRFEDEEGRPVPTLIERFDLPDAVRQRVGDPEDLVDIVRAILAAANVQATIDDDVLRYGDEAIIVLPIAPGTAVRPEDLNGAYIRFQESGAARGVVVTTGRLNFYDLRRRHALAPALGHAGSDGIQRMADAVAMGADPLAFVVEVPVNVS